MDVVFETLGGDNQTKSFQVLKPGGILVSIVGFRLPNGRATKGFVLYAVAVWDHESQEQRTRAQHKARFEPVMLQPEGNTSRLLASLSPTEN